MKHIYIFLSVLFLSACSTTYPPYTSYELRSALDVHQKQMVCSKDTLRVAKVTTSQALMRKKMFYVRGLESYSYTQSEWAKRPSEFITEAWIQTVQKSNVFKSVVGADSQAKSRYLLESRVEDFMQYYDTQLKHSYAKVAITFFLIDTKSGAVVANMHFEEEEPCESLDAKGGVKALNKLLDKASKSLSVWISQVECKE